MRYPILFPPFICIILVTVAVASATDDARPAAPIFTFSDYRGLAGPYTQFSLKDDGTWTNTVKRGGKNDETKSGKLTADELKAFLTFVKEMELEKHTRKRNVEDAAMVTVQVGRVVFSDIAPEPASKIINKLNEIREPKEK